MPHLIWTADALRDVARMQTFLAIHNPGAGRRAAAAIRRGAAILARHPEIGRAGLVTFRNVRELVIRFGASAYVLAYRFDGREVTIVEVRHGREIKR